MPSEEVEPVQLAEREVSLAVRDQLGGTSGAPKDKQEKGEQRGEVPNIRPLDPGTPSALAAPRRSTEQVRHFISDELRPPDAPMPDGSAAGEPVAAGVAGP